MTCTASLDIVRYTDVTLRSTHCISLLLVARTLIHVKTTIRDTHIRRDPTHSTNKFLNFLFTSSVKLDLSPSHTHYDFGQISQFPTYIIPFSLAWILNSFTYPAIDPVFKLAITVSNSLMAKSLSSQTSFFSFY